MRKIFNMRQSGFSQNACREGNGKLGRVWGMVSPKCCVKRGLLKRDFALWHILFELRNLCI
jgi:hypothetical protein